MRVDDGTKYKWEVFIILMLYIYYLGSTWDQKDWRNWKEQMKSESMGMETCKSIILKLEIV